MQIINLIKSLLKKIKIKSRLLVNNILNKFLKKKFILNNILFTKIKIVIIRKNNITNYNNYYFISKIIIAFSKFIISSFFISISNI